jgi:hypothetical protein
MQRTGRIFGAVELDDGPSLDVATILDNLVELDRMLEDGSRLDSIPYLELSKHLRIRNTNRDAA